MGIFKNISTKLIHKSEPVQEPITMKGIDGEMHKHIVDWSRVGMKDKKGNMLPGEVALCLQAVKYHRLKYMPLKTIYLKKRFYQKVEDWCRGQLLDSKAELNLPNITLDGVFIKELSALSLKDFDLDFYETTNSPKA